MRLTVEVGVRTAEGFWKPRQTGVDNHKKYMIADFLLSSITQMDY